MVKTTMRNPKTNPAELPWKAVATDTIDSVRIIAVDTDGCPYGPVADVHTSDGEGTNTLGPDDRCGPGDVEGPAGHQGTWDQHGLGDDNDASEGTYRNICQAIANATGRACPELFGGAVQPEPLMYSWPTRRGRKTVHRDRETNVLSAAGKIAPPRSCRCSTRRLFVCPSEPSARTRATPKHGPRTRRLFAVATTTSLESGRHADRPTNLLACLPQRSDECPERGFTATRPGR